MEICRVHRNWFLTRSTIVVNRFDGRILSYQSNNTVSAMDFGDRSRSDIFDIYRHYFVMLGCYLIQICSETIKNLIEIRIFFCTFYLFLVEFCRPKYHINGKFGLGKKKSLEIELHFYSCFLIQILLSENCHTNSSFLTQFLKYRICVVLQKF